jgi:hypothetical protein
MSNVLSTTQYILKRRASESGMALCPIRVLGQPAARAAEILQGNGPVDTRLDENCGQSIFRGLRLASQLPPVLFCRDHVSVG